MKQIKLMCILFTVVVTLTVFAPCTDAQNLCVRVGLAVPKANTGVKAALLTSSSVMSVYCNGTLLQKSTSVNVCASGETYTVNGDSVQGTIIIRSSGSITLSLGGDKNTYDGEIEISLESRQLKIINSLPLEDYVKGVMPCEIGSNECDEITKAAAVMIRTVPLQHKHQSDGYDVCATSCCQNYRGICTDERLCRIADETSGVIITYDGEPIVCTYCNSNGGASCPSGDAWGGDTLPYLQSVTLDEGDRCYFWQKTVSRTEFFGKIKEYLKIKTDIAGVSLGKSSSGFVSLLTCYDTDGNAYHIYGASQIRKLWDLQSARFDIDYFFASPMNVSSGNILMQAQNVVISGSGKGHCVGFSLAGAEVLADMGYNYRQILTFFFVGTEIKV